MASRSTLTAFKAVAILTTLAVVAWLSPTASAVPLPLAPNGIVAPTQTAGPPLGAMQIDGTVQAFQSQDMPINPNGTSYTGVLTTGVWTSYPGNLHGPNRLTFTFVLENNGPDRLDRLTCTDYTGYLTDVEYDAIVVPGTVPPLADRTPSGDAVGWNFGNLPGLVAGANGARLIIHTNATQYVPSLSGIINGATASVLSFGPAPVPEPATLAAAALAGFGLLARRRASR